ncbi:MAG: hypothetical protein J0H73_01145, partial [Salana multivorans]|nr:hypothetical protein [Salana multivorans]
MRWPWSRDRADDASVEPAAPGGGVDAVPGPVAPRVAPRGWAFLPPLQRTVAPAPLPAAPPAGIDDDEFEALLDSLHGKPGQPAAPSPSPAPSPATTA